MIRDLKTLRWGRSLVLMASMACGPETATTDSGTGTSTSNAANSTDIPTGSSTGAPVTCGRIHEGDLHVHDDTDLASLMDVARVTGGVSIFMGDRDQRDLSFLGCLNTIDLGLSIDMNTRLESTKGLGNLKSVQVISITENGNLRVVTGFDQIRELIGFNMDANSALEEVQFDSLETVGWMSIGFCQGTQAAAHHLSLTALSGFSGLTTVGDVTLEGNEVLMSAGLLDALKANGATTPLNTAIIRFNPLLPEATVNAQLDALDVAYREVCGNAEGDPECYCIVGE